MTETMRAIRREIAEAEAKRKVCSRCGQLAVNVKVCFEPKCPLPDKKEK